MISSSEYLLLGSVYLQKICFFVTFVSAVTVNVFENEGVPNNTTESAFQFIVRNSWITTNDESKNQKTWCLLYHGRNYNTYNVLSLEDPHLIHPTSRIDCFTVLLRTLLNTCKQLCKKNGYMLGGTLGWTGNESMCMGIFLYLWTPINIWQIEFVIICIYSKGSEDRFVVVQHFWCRKTCKVEM